MEYGDVVVLNVVSLQDKTKHGGERKQVKTNQGVAQLVERLAWDQEAGGS